MIISRPAPHICQGKENSLRRYRHIGFHLGMNVSAGKRLVPCNSRRNNPSIPAVECQMSAKRTDYAVSVVPRQRLRYPSAKIYPECLNIFSIGKIVI